MTPAKPERCIRSALPEIEHSGMTFPRFHRHLYKEEQDEIGGQDEHQDPTAVYGRI